MISLRNKRFILTILVLLCMTFASAQNVHYYKLTSKVEKGKSSSNVSGGQYITFIADICYESNKKGISVGHGNMTRNKNYSTLEYTTYFGSSYWGDDVASFKFNADKSVLKVVVDKDNYYIYKRATAPAGQETCSLIRKKTPTEQGGGGGGEIVVPPTPIVVNPNNPTLSTTPTPTPTPTPGPKMKDCPTCHGSGRCNNCNGHKVRLVMGQYVDCTNCNRTGNCPYCHGSGKVVTH